MKNKHRRLFGHNNRNRSHFFKIAAGRVINLVWQRIHNRLNDAGLLTVVLITATSAMAQTPSQLDTFLANTLTANFSDVAIEDRSFQLNGSAEINKSCEASINFNFRGQVKAGKNTLVISCEKPYWQQYATVSFNIFKRVVISAAPLDRYIPLEASLLTTQKMDISTLRMGYFTEVASLRGYLLQRTVKSGQVITPYIAKAPNLINRGDWVTIISGVNGLTVTSKGEAMKDGVKGDQILVKNLTTNTKIRAWVVKKGLVSTSREHI